MKILRKYLPWLLLLVSAAMLLGLLVWKVDDKDHREKKAEYFSGALKSAAAETDSLLEWVSNPMFLKDPFLSMSSGTIAARLTRQKTTLYITLSDSLVFWSDNNVPFPDGIDTLRSGTVFLNGNGFYLFKEKDVGDQKIIALRLVQSSYFYQNSYLQNDLSDDLCTDCPFTVVSENPDSVLQIEGIKNPVLIRFSDNVNLFSPKEDVLIVFTLFAALILLAIAFYKIIQRLGFFREKPFWKRLSLGIVPVLLYFLGKTVYGLPVYDQLSINSPTFFAFSTRFTHLAPLMLTAFLLIVYVAYFSQEILLFAGRKRKKLFSKVAFLFVTFFLTASLACSIVQEISTFLFNTSLDFNFNDILSFDIRSVHLFFTVFFLFTAVILLHYLMISLVNRLRLNFKTWLVVSICFLILGSAGAYLLHVNIILFLGVSVYLLIMQFVFSRYMYSNKAVYLLLNIVFAAGITTIALNDAILQKQYDQLKLLSLNLATEQDPLAEEFLSDVLPKVAADTLLQHNPFKKDKDFNVTEYLKKKHFNGYLGKYILQVTWCGIGEEIIVQPADTSVNCVGFFEDIAFRTGIPTLADNVVFINDGTGRGYYLCTIKIEAPSDTSYIFAELIPASSEKGLGYPDLLMDVHSGIKTIPASISYARYQDNKLVSRYGKYNYPNVIDTLFSSMPEETIVHQGGYIHFRLTISDNLVLIITENDKEFSSFLAPFSYILLFFGVLTICFLFIAGRVFGFRIRFAVSFSSRLQWMIILIILVIFFLAGFIAVYNLSSLNGNKNKEIVSEKAHSLVIELEHKLSLFGPLTPDDEPYITELLFKFGQVFFTDLNVYSLDGKLLATTRSQIFEKQLVSDRMNAQAYYALKHKNNSFLLQTETIGNMDFTSTYVPIRNESNEIIAYLNLPYFARENELNREISSFISTFINIYLLIILITVLVTIVISNYVTQPLRLIKDKLRNIKLGTTNEKIRWKRRDEIGDLVFEYNRMIEELAHKADLLARSERELAWREMAKQVAHEIKNPLTPMKLSTQYLEKAWNDKAGDFDERIRRFAQTMTEQIDSLSDIATAFSHFGKLPESTMLKICINDVLSSVVTLYRNEEYEISLHLPDKAMYVYADESQLLRVFNNLLKNAQQAFVPERRGQLNVSLIEIKDKARVVISDNGCGMSDEQKKKIFQPNFTTKTSGSGLGLAMVKNIVDGFNGRIWFESVENVGTTFSVEFPLA